MARPAPGAEFEPVSPLDVPAFLRTAGRASRIRLRLRRRRPVSAGRSSGHWSDAAGPRQAGRTSRQPEPTVLTRDSPRCCRRVCVDPRRIVAGRPAARRRRSCRGAPSHDEVLATTRTRASDVLAREVGYVHEAARRPAARRARVSEHLLGRDVEPRLPDGLPPVQRPGRRRLRAGVPAAEAGAAGAARDRHAARDARVADAGRATSTSSRSRSRSSGTTPTSSRCCGWPGMPPRRRASATARHPLVVIGGAVTFVNPEPLAPFADVIAAGEGEVLVPALMRGAARGDRSRATCCGGSRSERGFYVPSFYDVRLRERRHASPAFEPRAGHAARRRSSRRRRSRPPTRSIRRRRRSSRPTPSSARASSSKSCAAAPTCAASAGPGYNYLPVRAFPADRILELAAQARRARRAAPASCRSRSAITRTSSASSTACSSMGYSISPASLRLDDLTEPIVRRAARERRAVDHHRAGDRLRSAAPRDQQDGHQRRDPRPRRADLRERHREPEALLHDRPPDRDRRGPRGDSRSDAADARRHAEARPPARPRSAASSAASTR